MHDRERRLLRRTSRYGLSAAAPVLAALWTGSAFADHKAKDVINPFAGGFAQVVVVPAPAFRGLEPRLSLTYASSGGNGLMGVGWSLAGFSAIERAKPGRGSPRWNGSDIYLLDGNELLACPSSSPSCTTGGTHHSKQETYLRISFQAASNSFEVFGRDGTKTVFSPILTIAAGVVRYGQTSTTDTRGNVVSYAWSCIEGDCYPDQVAYGPYSIKLYREVRPDVLTFAIGDTQSLARTRYRLRSILVKYQISAVRALKLTYAQSPVTGRSLLTGVQEFGTDVVVDANGVISGGTSLPVRSFVYWSDPVGKLFNGWGGQ